MMKTLKRLFAGLLLAGALAGQAAAADYDVIIRGGTIYDGQGGAPFAGDLAIEGDRIAAIGDLSGSTAGRVVEAHGLAVAPGFINMLSWANESLIQDGRSQSDIRQGVTLEVMGEGDSMGPLTPAMKAEIETHQGDIKYKVGWTTLGGYLDFLAKKGISTNVASFVGATTVRRHEVGSDAKKATPEQLARMQELVREGMREGALGVGSSLIYAPANFADTDELIALTSAAHEFGGGYISHIRSEGNNVEQAIDEIIAIGRTTGAPVQIYHMKIAGAENWSKARPMLAKLWAARAQGVDITADIYPYTAGATGLDAAMPLWVQEGGHDAWVRRLKDPAIRARVLAEMRAPPVGWENLYRLAGDPKNVLLLGFKNDKLKPLTGKTLAEVAAMRGTSPEDTMIDLVIEDDSRVSTAFFLMNEDNVRLAMAWPWTMIGTDEGSYTNEGVFLKSNAHPRAYGSFARFLGKYIRDEKVMPLQEGIRRLTSLPATQLKLHGRGQLAPGYFADVVLFDPATIADKATYDKPHQYSVGVRDVFVNGVQVIKAGEHTGATPGRVVRGPGWTGWSKAAPSPVGGR